MSKFFKGFLFGGSITSIVTLLLVKSSGKENRQKVSHYLQNIQQNATQLNMALSTLNQAKREITSQVIPQLNQSLKDIQTTLRHFKEDNQPRLKRIQDKVNTLQSHIKSNQSQD
ncbi:MULTISPECIES: YtxH domain-containing protein [unclassified Granulicatella]|uniref:YtxH domain-containing protein n=1 Tax=unclassified Granulicatella TaxID=2630493 RepID=UPI0010745E2B|nr:MULTISPECIES: YtxH domain-containing protein [unclassified Granulicatella]MBF0780861.1 YtxH domain-containing protein [Granulicatella sp. 19428wC4_WM01]TFU93499.1 hypothetical protein E4T68_07085 [Granulicatella sp. WM01]